MSSATEAATDPYPPAPTITNSRLQATLLALGMLFVASFPFAPSGFGIIFRFLWAKDSDPRFLCAVLSPLPVRVQPLGVCANPSHSCDATLLLQLALCPRMQRVSALAANLVPATWLMSGPKVPTANAPRKCSPASEASNPAVSSG